MISLDFLSLKIYLNRLKKVNKKLQSKLNTKFTYELTINKLNHKERFNSYSIEYL